MKRFKTIIAITAILTVISLPMGSKTDSPIKRLEEPETSEIIENSESVAPTSEIIDSSTIDSATEITSSDVMSSDVASDSTSELISSETSDSSGVEVIVPNKKDPIFTDFQTFIDWFARVVIPWLVAFFTAGGAGTLILKVAKLVSNQWNTNKVVSQATDELNALRGKYSDTITSIKARDELLLALINSQINEQTKAELMEAYDALPKVAELETSKVTVKVKIKKKKNKTQEVIPHEETIS